jgi:hypothetical protein
VRDVLEIVLDKCLQNGVKNWLVVIEELMVEELMAQKR